MLIKCIRLELHAYPQRRLSTDRTPIHMFGFGWHSLLNIFWCITFEHSWQMTHHHPVLTPHSKLAITSSVLHFHGAPSQAQSIFLNVHQSVSLLTSFSFYFSLKYGFHCCIMPLHMIRIFQLSVSNVFHYFCFGFSWFSTSFFSFG